MDTSIFGRSFLSAAAAKTARKTGQSPPLLCWLAHCDVTSRDIIIILINAVTHHKELLFFRLVDNLGVSWVIMRGKNPRKLVRQSKICNPPARWDKLKNSRSHATVNELPADWQTGKDMEDLDWMRWQRVVERLLAEWAHRHADMVAAKCGQWTCLRGKQRWRTRKRTTCFYKKVKKSVQWQCHKCYCLKWSFHNMWNSTTGNWQKRIP